MVTRRPVGSPEGDCLPSGGSGGRPEVPGRKPTMEELEAEFGSLEALQDIFLSPPKFVVGTTVSEAAYRLMVKTEGGVSAFWTEAIQSFDGDLAALVNAAAAFEEERRRGRHKDGTRTAHGRVSREMWDRVLELEQALASIKRMSRSKVMAGLAKLLLSKRGDWTYPLNL